MESRLRLAGKIRVLIVDDSALVRSVFAKGLSSDPEIEIAGVAGDPYRARDILLREKPDVITLDVEMPRMDGVTFLRKYMQVIPTPTIMVSSMTEAGKQITLDALEAGAVDIMAKPKVGLVDALPMMIAELIEKVKCAARADVRRFAAARKNHHMPQGPASRVLESSTDMVIAIGSSTGGTEALARLLPLLPASIPGIAIVQHMPPGFTDALAKRLDDRCPFEVHEAKDGDRLRPGLALIAPGGEEHMSVRRSGGQYVVRLARGEKVSGHRPSVDVLFDSIATDVGGNAVAVLLTGMGKDGARGMLAIRKSGGTTWAQDEESSVVWGMPGEAWKMGAAERLVSLDNVPTAIVDSVVKRR